VPGCPRPRCSTGSPTSTGSLARVDLGYPWAKLAIEYDGATHFTARRARLDRERDGLLASHGWQTLRLAGDDIGIAMHQTANRVAELLALRTR
jgi:very-short-patch-repair endonuclease